MAREHKRALSSNLKALQGSTLRRLRSTPGYFFLIWRWSMWLYALIIISGVDSTYKVKTVYLTTVFLLIATFIQSAIVTLYAPVLRLLFPLRRPQQTALDDEIDIAIVPPLARTRNFYWDIAVYALDVIICGLVMYYSGPFSVAPDFGVSSPFYRYGLSTVMAAGLAYQYRGGLAAAFGFDLFVLLGMLLPAPGAPNPPYHPNVIDIAASLIDAPIIAILTGYLASLLTRLTTSRHELQHTSRIIQDSARRETYLRGIMESLVRLSQERQDMLQKSLEQTRQGGHFHAVFLTTPILSQEGDSVETPPFFEATITGYTVTDQSRKLFAEVLQSGQRYADELSASNDTERLYLPFLKNGQIAMVLGAESKLKLSNKDEIFLTTVGAQLLVALENISLAEQTIQLAAAAERGRMAREIHDGIAQLIYMLSLNAETCVAQAQRIAEASEEDAELISPLAHRLETLVTITKQALWETRAYMFTLKPLVSGSMTVAQMLTNQLQEFETISGLSTRLEVTNLQASDRQEHSEPDQQASQKEAQIGMTIFRIVQEALTNAYKHAEASSILVRLSITAQQYTVEVCDDGKGLSQPVLSKSNQSVQQLQRLYSGYGLSGMQERVQELAGSLEIGPGTTGGVRVYAILPR